MVTYTMSAPVDESAQAKLSSIIGVASWHQDSEFTTHKRILQA